MGKGDEAVGSSTIALAEKGPEPSGSQQDGKGDVKERETWSGKIDFLLALIGFSVGLGNVWRFPYLCYKNGGGAFLIPYFICVIFGGVPLLFLEIAVGQYMSAGGMKAWNIVPLFQGIGLASVIIVFFLNCYYNVILSWAFYYMFASFTTELPWSRCGDWSSSSCCDNCTWVDPRSPNYTNTSAFNDPVTEYWERVALGISDGIDQMGTVKWDLALCLLFAWIVVYACICKGIRSSGKVMYVTATSPYIFMLCLLIRNCLLDGAREGVLFYLTPNFTKIGDMEVWVDAGTQIFFSYSIALGSLTALGSYNKFNAPCYRDSILFSIANSGTSFFAGFIVFTILGFMAKKQNRPIASVAESGPGLAFIAYPKAVAQMPIAPLWSILFFLMVILLGLDSQFVGVEGVITCVVDQWPHLLRKGYRREIFIGVVCFISFLVGLSMVTNGGMYVFQLFDYYSGSKIILFVAFFECLAIGYIYGARRFYDNLKMMLGFRINPFMMVCWLTLSPIFCAAVFIMSAINYSELTYARPSTTYVYPTWAVAIGWSMAALSAIFIPIVMVYKLFYIYFKFGSANYWHNFKLLLVPRHLEPHQKRPQDWGERCLSNPNPSLEDRVPPSLQDRVPPSLQDRVPPSLQDRVPPGADPGPPPSYSAAKVAIPGAPGYVPYKAGLSNPAFHQEPESYDTRF